MGASFTLSTLLDLLFCSCAGANYYGRKGTLRSCQKTKAAQIKEDAREDEWKHIKIRHDNTVLAWKTECERLKVAGTWPKDLLTKPKRPLKPKPVVEHDPDDNEEEESGEDE